MRIPASATTIHANPAMLLGSDGEVCTEIGVTPPTACSRSGFVISKVIPAPLPELAWMRKACSDAVRPAPLKPPQGSSIWNESLRARPPCNHYLATVRCSAVDSAPHLSTAQAVDLSG